MKGSRGVLQSRSGESKQSYFFQRRASNIIDKYNGRQRYLLLAPDKLYTFFPRCFDGRHLKDALHNRRTPRVRAWSSPRDESEIAHKDRPDQHTSSIRSGAASKCADRRIDRDALVPLEKPVQFVS